jgi:hypothetical protein
MRRKFALTTTDSVYSCRCGPHDGAFGQSSSSNSAMILDSGHKYHQLIIFNLLKPMSQLGQMVRVSRYPEKGVLVLCHKYYYRIRHNCISISHICDNDHIIVTFTQHNVQIIHPHRYTLPLQTFLSLASSLTEDLLNI